MGDERLVKSKESTSGEVDLDGMRCGDVRSRLSTSGEAGLAGCDCGAVWFSSGFASFAVSVWAIVRSRLSTSSVGALVLLSRGEMRRVRVVFARVFCFSFVFVELDEDNDGDAFEDIAVSGERARAVGANCGAFSGEEKVRSTVSIIPDERRNCDGVGTGASSNMPVVCRNLVGV